MMTTLPADQETVRLARKLAEAAGKPVPVVVREAIAAKAAADGLPVETSLLASLAHPGVVSPVTSYSPA